MIKAIPYIYTMNHDDYRDLVLQKFDESMIEEYFENIVQNVLDDRYVNKVTNDRFEFNDNGSYRIIHGKMHDIEFEFPCLKTLEEFICDCYRSSVDLQWKESVVQNNRNMFMNRDHIQSYTEELLNKIEKQ